mgnify:CR=1 FL=1
MQEKKFVKQFKTAKIIQLGLLLGIQIIFFLILACNADLSSRIYSDKALFILCIITWILMIFNLLSLLFDFSKLRSFNTESHALTQAAYLDHLTGIPNRHSLDVIFRTYTTTESLADIGCAMFTISNLKELNKTQGHQAGDLIIQNFSNIFEEIGDSYGFVSRNGGNEYVAVINHCDHDIMQAFLTALENRISLYNADHAASPILLHSAYTLYAEEQVNAFTQLLTATYNKLYSAL